MPSIYIPVARPKPLSTSATRFGHPLNDNNSLRYKSEGEETNADEDKRVSARRRLSPRKRRSFVVTSIADHSSGNRGIYGDSVGFSNVSNFEISKFYWTFFERSVFVKAIKNFILFALWIPFPIFIYFYFLLFILFTIKWQIV